MRFDLRSALSSLGRDLRYGARLARGTPLFTAIVVATIALGIGANAAIFSVVDAVLLRPLPFGGGDRLVSLWSTNPDKTVTRFAVSYGDFRDWQTRTKAFDGMTLYTPRAATMITSSGPESISALLVTRNFFDVLGVHPQFGRFFGPDDERGESSDAVVLSYGFWRRRFGADISILNKQYSINGRVRKVIGVMPADAGLLGPALTGQALDVVTVVEFSSFPAVQRHAQHLFGAIALLKPGVTLQKAREDLYGTEVQLAKENAEIAGWTASVFPLTEDLSLGVKRPLLVLLAAAGLVLLIACINVANLLLVRGAARAREIAVRQAMGASRGRLVSQFVVESIALGLAGGALGVGLAFFALQGIREMIPAGTIARADDITLDGRVLAFAVVLSVLSAALFGLWPAVRASAVGLSNTLRDGGRSSTGSARANRSRRTLVVIEVALALVLVVCAGLVMQSLRNILHVDPGFQPEHTITAQVTLGQQYPDSTAIAFYRSVITNLEQTPGVDAAGATDTPPLSGGGIFTSIRLVGQPPRPPDQPLMSTIRVVTPGFFKAMGMRTLAGHDIEWNEPAPSMVLSETAAKAFWPNQPVIDKQIAFNVEPNGLQVVGEVNDVTQTSLSSPAAPVVYVSLRRSMRIARSMAIVVRGRGDVASLVSTLRAAVRAQDPNLPIYNVQTMQSIVDASTAQSRLNTMLLAVFAVAALLLSALGIYGVVSYSVTQRQQELGVRVALGAQRGDVLRLVLGEGAVLATIGVGLGLVGAFAATPLIQSWLFEIGRADVKTFAGVAAGLIVVAIAASYLPARRATRVDPLIAMRGD